MEPPVFESARRARTALTVTARRRLLYIASLAPGVLIADLAVGVWRDPVMLGVGVVLIAGAVLAHLRPKPRVLGRAARPATPQNHEETRS